VISIAAPKTLTMLDEPSATVGLAASQSMSPSLASASNTTPMKKLPPLPIMSPSVSSTALARTKAAAAKLNNH
jgi:hypothetical protein